MFAKKTSHNLSCLVGHLVVAFLFLLVTIASFVGVYMTHVSQDHVTFGTSGGSLALLAFAVNLGFLVNALKECWRKCEICK